MAGKERFAFKGVASNLVTYLTDVVKMSNSSAAKTVNRWCGFTFIMPLLVAPLADSYWDRYSTILVFSFIYVVVSIHFIFFIFLGIAAYFVSLYASIKIILTNSRSFSFAWVGGGTFL